jgi:CxxC-x17-CxxC domain-containing protein
MACVDCGQEFTFTSGEQSFYAQRGFTEPPKRCASCRTARKAQRGSTDAGGGSYAGYGDSGGYGGGGGYGGERPPRQMFAAECADCGKTAQLPFQPTGARPVYCSDCFQTRR